MGFVQTEIAATVHIIRRSVQMRDWSIDFTGTKFYSGNSFIKKEIFLCELWTMRFSSKVQSVVIQAGGRAWNVWSY